MAFGINPSGTPAPNPEVFPTFIQWQEAGENLGGADADTVNTGLGIVATRGEGEDYNVITLTAEIEVQALGVPFESVTALNIGAGLTATQDEFGVVTVTTEAPAEFAWRTVTDDDAIVVLADSGNGISMSSADAHVVTIDASAILPGRCVLVEQAGAGTVTFATTSGVDLVYRSAFEASIAGQYGIISLIGRPDGSVLLCGDMTSAP
jgi:hypothetical protein